MRRSSGAKPSMPATRALSVPWPVRVCAKLPSRRNSTCAGSSPASLRAMYAMRSAPAVWLLEGPTITGPMISVNPIVSMPAPSPSPPYAVVSVSVHYIGLPPARVAVYAWLTVLTCRGNRAWFRVVCVSPSSSAPRPRSRGHGPRSGGHDLCPGAASPPGIAPPLRRRALALGVRDAKNRRFWSLAVKTDGFSRSRKWEMDFFIGCLRRGFPIAQIIVCFGLGAAKNRQF